VIRRLGLVAAGATAAQRSLRFPADDDAVEAMGALAPPAPFDTAVRGPERRCRETAGLLGVEAAAVDALRAWDFGEWSGQRIEDVADTDPARFGGWRQDPSFVPPGGESLAALVGRVGRWMDGTVDGRFLGVADPTVVRAAVIHALGVAPATAWRVDVEPLAGVVLERSGPGWRVLLGTPPRLRQTGGRGGPGGSAGPGGAAGRRP
jgi:broad specificity phosphatase PhoE